MPREIQLGESIRARLERHYLTQVWLIAQLRERGLIVEKSRLSSALRGTLHGPGIDRILVASDEIMKKYEKYYK